MRNLLLNRGAVTRSEQLIRAPLPTPRTARGSTKTSSIWISLPTCPVRILADFVAIERC